MSCGACRRRARRRQPLAYLVNERSFRLQCGDWPLKPWIPERILGLRFYGISTEPKGDERDESSDVEENERTSVVCSSTGGHGLLGTSCDDTSCLRCMRLLGVYPGSRQFTLPTELLSSSKRTIDLLQREFVFYFLRRRLRGRRRLPMIV